MSTAAETLEQLVAQAKADAITNLTKPKPIPKTPAPLVSLDPASDTGALGDDITANQTIAVRVANPQGITWYDANGNGALDGSDPVAVNGLITLTLPQTGANAMSFYQQAAGQAISSPTVYTVYLDPVQNTFQQIAYDQHLQTLALAYWGRPLVPDELVIGSNVLTQTHGDDSPLIDFLGQSPEFLHRYQGASIPWAIADIFQNLYDRAPTATELSTAFTLIGQGTPVTQLPALIAENPATAADRAVLAAKISLAQELTRQHDTLLKAPSINGNELGLLVKERQLLDTVHDDATLQQALRQISSLSETPDVVTSGTGAIIGTTITLEFSSPVDWKKLDADGNGILTIKNLNDPNDTGELGIAWGGKGGATLDNAGLSAAAVPLPADGDRFLSIPGVRLSDNDTNEDNNEMSILVIGVTNSLTGAVSDVLFDGLT